MRASMLPRVSPAAKAENNDMPDRMIDIYNTSTYEYM